MFVALCSQASPWVLQIPRQGQDYGLESRAFRLAAGPGTQLLASGKHTAVDGLSQEHRGDATP